MPLETLAELFEVGAQHTVEQVIEREGFSLGIIFDALRRRFGPELTASEALLEDFVFRVRQGMFTARRIEQPDPERPPDPPNIPGLETGYQYTVIVSVPDPEQPDNPSRNIEVPLTIPSAEPLDLDALREYIENLLGNWDPPRDTIPGGPAADLIRRDVLIRSRIMDFGGEPEGLFDFNIISVYHGSR